MPRKKKQSKSDKVPAREATEVVLLRAGKPMHYREITRQAIELGLVKVRGSSRRKPDPDKTMKTVRSYLCAEEGDKFVRVGPGIFDLKNRKALEAARKKAEGAKANA